MSNTEFDYYYNNEPVAEQLAQREAELMIREGISKSFPILDLNTDLDFPFPGETINFI